jgi:hypothetical protein
MTPVVPHAPARRLPDGSVARLDPGARRPDAGATLSGGSPCGCRGLAPCRTAARNCSGW